MAMAATAAVVRAGRDSPGAGRRLEREGAEDINRIFDKYDADVSGSIDKKELLAGLSELGVTGLSHTQLDQLVVHFGGEGATSLEIEQFDVLVQELRKAMKEQAKKRNRPVLPKQLEVQAAYDSNLVVYSVATMIVINFVMNIAEKEIDPHGILYPTTWMYIDYFFNIFYLFELLFNMYGWGGPRRVFWKSTWNIFDFMVVSVGMIIMLSAVAGFDLGPLKILKLIRVFRVFRIFKRVKSLNKIITAIMRCIPGVINSFVIMLIFFAIYAILAVELFQNFGAGGEYSTACGDALTCGEDFFNYGTLGALAQINVSSVTARGFTYGFEYYGTFSRAMFTLFQVMTGESWSEAVARPLIFGYSKTEAVVATLYFVSFIILTQFVLVNVVVAVLLDKFVTEDPAEFEDEIDVSELLTGPKAPPSPVGNTPAGFGSPLGADASADAKLDRMLQLLDMQRAETAKLASQVDSLMRQAKLTA